MSGSGRPWFRAKRYGWGWGLPATWQGWVVLVGWSAFFVSGMLWFVPETPVAKLAFAVFSCAVLIAVCWAKGEPPRWRWGDDR